MEIEAAGEVVVREREGGRREVAVVHRPKYGLVAAEGQAPPGRGMARAALREVAEETGLLCEVVAGARHDAVHDRKGRPKQVRWWLMRPLGGEFEPSDEVDELRWIPLERAAEVLDYEQDREPSPAAGAYRPLNSGSSPARKP